MARKKALETRLRSSLRLLWLRSDHRYAAVKQARVGRGKYECSKCKEIFPYREIQIDHVEPLGSFTIETIGNWIYRLFFSDQVALCRLCHYRKTHE